MVNNWLVSAQSSELGDLTEPPICSRKSPAIPASLWKCPPCKLLPYCSLEMGILGVGHQLCTTQQMLALCSGIVAGRLPRVLALVTRPWCSSAPAPTLRFCPNPSLLWGQRYSSGQDWEGTRHMPLAVLTSLLLSGVHHRHRSTSLPTQDLTDERSHPGASRGRSISNNDGKVGQTGRARKGVFPRTVSGAAGTLKWMRAAKRRLCPAHGGSDTSLPEQAPWSRWVIVSPQQSKDYVECPSQNSLDCSSMNVGNDGECA